MQQLKATQENTKRYVAQVASLGRVKEAYELHRQLIDGANAFESMCRTDKVRFINKFKLYRHKNSKAWASLVAFLMT